MEYVSCTTAAFLTACSASEWGGLPGRCRWCDTELAGRRTRWCSTACSVAFAANHYWSQARHAALKRDGRQCQECGCDPRAAMQSALDRGVSTYLAQRRLDLQVHHIVPVMGRHAVAGCHHHQDGLVTLCLHHHVLRHKRLRDEDQTVLDVA